MRYVLVHLDLSKEQPWLNFDDGRSPSDGVTDVMPVLAFLYRNVGAPIHADGFVVTFDLSTPR